MSNDTNEVIIDNETGEEVKEQESKALAPAMTEKQAIKLIKEIKSGIVKLRDNIIRLHDGEAHTALGYPSFTKFATAVFGYDERHTRRLLETARVAVTTLPLLTAGEDQDLLARLPDDALQALKGLEPDHRALIIAELAKMDGTPTLLDVLESIPAEMLTDAQFNQLEKLRSKKAKKGKTVDWAADGRAIIERIEKLYVQLSSIEYIAALGYGEDFGKMIREELSFMADNFAPLPHASDYDDEEVDDVEDYDQEEMSL